MRRNAFQGMTIYNESILNTPSDPGDAARRLRLGRLRQRQDRRPRSGFGIFYDRFNDDQILHSRELPPHHHPHGIQHHHLQPARNPFASARPA